MGIFAWKAKPAAPKRTTTDVSSLTSAVKGEDTNVTATLELEADWSVAMHAIFDGHGGPSAALRCAELFPQAVFGAYAELTGERQPRLERALVRAFARVDKAIRASAGDHGTTATVVVISDETITIANVGDSAAYLHRLDSSVQLISADHRVGSCGDAELERVLRGGAEIRQARDERGASVGPKRVFPGGLMMTRSIGDADASEAVVSRPDLTVISYPPEGCTLVLASDGIWDFIAQDVVCRLVAVAQKADLSAGWLAQAVLTNALERNTRIDDATIIAILLPPRAPKRRPLLQRKGSMSSAHVSPNVTPRRAPTAHLSLHAQSTATKVQDGRRASLPTHVETHLARERPPQRSNFASSQPRPGRASATLPGRDKSPEKRQSAGRSIFASSQPRPSRASAALPRRDKSPGVQPSCAKVRPSRRLGFLESFGLRKFSRGLSKARDSSPPPPSEHSSLSSLSAAGSRGVRSAKHSMLSEQSSVDRSSMGEGSRVGARP